MKIYLAPFLYPSCPPPKAPARLPIDFALGKRRKNPLSLGHAMFDQLERLGNAILDEDWTWWPFLFLRPSRRDPMDTRRVLWMSVYFGPIFGLAVMLAVQNLRLYADIRVGMVGIITTTISAFSIYRMTFAVLWNRRAARLRALNPDPTDSWPTRRLAGR